MKRKVSHTETGGHTEKRTGNHTGKHTGKRTGKHTETYRKLTANVQETKRKYKENI